MDENGIAYNLSLIHILGDAGKRLHTGRSRNDQVALDSRLNLREASLHLQGQIKELILKMCIRDRYRIILSAEAVLKP